MRFAVRLLPPLRRQHDDPEKSGGVVDADGVVVLAVRGEELVHLR